MHLSSWLSQTSTNTTSFQSHQLLFSHASAEVRGKNTPGRKFASTRYRTQNHQVMSPTCSPLSHPGWCSYFKTLALTQTYRYTNTWNCESLKEGKPAQSTQADMGQNFRLSVNFQHVKGPFHVMTQLVV